MTKNDKLISLVLEYQKTKNKNILNEIIELNKRLVNWYLENTKLNITSNELYNLIIKGITIASLTYNKYKNDNITRYFAMGIRNTIDEEANFGTRSRKVLFETFLDYKRLIESRYQTTLEKDFNIFDDIIDLMLEDRIFRESDKLEVKRRILEILRTYQGNLRIMNESPKSLLFEFPYDISNLDEIMQANLTNLEYNILCFSYGLFNNPKLSLDDISKKYNLGLSTVKLYKDIALRKLKGSLEYYFNKQGININRIKQFLNTILSKEEYHYFILDYGLFDEKEVRQTDIASSLNASKGNVSLIINTAISKISFILNNYNKIIPNLKLIKSYLETILSELEFEVFASSYGLFGYQKLDNDGICQEYNLDKNSLYELNKNIKENIRNTFYDFFDKEKIDNYLKSIFNPLEYKMFNMYYGLPKRIKQKEIAESLNMTTSYVNIIIQNSLEKLIAMINLSLANFDLSKVNNFLKNVLDENEYLVLCYKYGLYNHKKLLLKDIAKELKVSVEEAIVLNNLLTMKLRRYLNENKHEKVLAIK